MSFREVLLIYPSYTYPRKSPPLGLAYLAAYLQQLDFQVRIVDFNIADMSDENFCDILKSKDWLFVGMSFMTNQYAEALRLSQIIKKRIPHTPFIAGGPHASSIPERTLEEIPGIDVIVKGEGEETLKELADRYAHGDSLEDVSGIYYRDGSCVVKTTDRDLIHDLDSIPFPAWHLLDVNKYDVFSIGAKGDIPTFALLSSRGCPNACVFCDSHTIFSRTFRARSAQNIYKEIIYLHDEYGMTSFDFVDDLITVSKPRVLELCKMLQESRVPFRWAANARVNTVDREMLQAMKDAGCERVDYGVESGDPNVRRLMKKNVTDEQIRSAHKMARDVGISTGSFTMVGNLGETADSVKMTVDLLKDIGDDVLVSIACPFPGTELFRIGKEKDYINTEDWSAYVTSPTYSDGYHPVMRTEFMSEREILDSFYYLHSFFAKRKFQHRFGERFYINPKFYNEWVFKREGLARRLGMALKLVKARVKSARQRGVIH